MKNRGLIIFLIVLLILCAILLSGILFVSLSGKGRLFRGFASFDRTVDKVIYDREFSSDVNDVLINANAANIEVKEGTENRLVVYGEDKYLNVSEDKDLVVNYSEKGCKFFCFNVKVGKVIVYLNADFKGNIRVDNDYGDVEIGEFKESMVRVKSAYGDTSVKAAKEVDIESSAGDVEVGTVFVARIENNYGDIIIDRVNQKLDISDDCGDIKIKQVNLTENSSIDNDFGSVKIDVTNDILIDADVSLGDKKVNNNNYKSDVVLKIKNDCGDIKVN